MSRTNCTELDVAFERALVLIHEYFGIITFLLNCLVLRLIMTDNDDRNKEYRKYLFRMLFLSLLLDTFSDLYSPIFLMHKGLFFSDSLLAEFISIGQFISVELLILGEIFFALFACTYYRRGAVMRRDSFANFFGWKRKLFFIVAQLYAFASILIVFYFLSKALQATGPLPTEYHWVTSRKTYLYLEPNFYAKCARFSSTAAAFVAILGVYGSIVQTVSVVNKGLKLSSATTRRYQHLAVRSFVMQGITPCLVYIIPLYANNFLQFSHAIFNLGDTFDYYASIISPILWIVITKHTFASSLTILYCSPSYRQKLMFFITR